MKVNALSDVVSLADLATLAFAEGRAGCARAPLHEDDGVRASVLRVQPGSGVPAHKHSHTHDLFVGIKGELEIRWDKGCAHLKPGGFCRVPPGVRHEVRNLSGAHDAYCVLLHTGRGPFDFVEAGQT